MFKNLARASVQLCAMSAAVLSLVVPSGAGAQPPLPSPRCRWPSCT